MWKKGRKLLAAVLTLSLVFSMAGMAFAYDTPAAGEAATTAAVEATDQIETPALFAAKSGYLKINTPKNKAVYYKGEKIPVSLTIKSVGDDRLAYTGVGIARANADDFAWFYEDFMDGITYKEKVNTKKFKTGSYILVAALAAVSFDDDYYGDGDDSEIDPEDTLVSVNFTLKTLKAPTKLKATAGKRKVTVTYKKASGAKKYEIYRSTKKSSGYKKIATTSKTKYVDKKVKKRKKYYYKVRSVRTGNGTVRSSYTGAKLTGKVK